MRAPNALRRTDSRWSFCLRLETGDVCFKGKSGKHLLLASISPFDPTRTQQGHSVRPVVDALRLTAEARDHRND
jgi:hypothetical protein